MRIRSFVLAAALAAACSKSESGVAPGGAPGGARVPVPVPAGPFKLAWSEYPSWSVFWVAHTRGYVNGKAGELGWVERKWNVDIELVEADYGACIGMYSDGKVDAAALTTLDALPPALTRPSVVIMPTSTSYGADAAVVEAAKVKTIDDLRRYETRGLDLSVSLYVFARNLELRGKNPKNFKFTNMDPGAAAMAMQQKQGGLHSIMVWNPFVLQTLRNRGAEVKVLFDSTTIPGEIIDAIIVSQSALDRPGGTAFAKAVADAFYTVNRDLADQEERRRDTLVGIGEKFSSLGADDMEVVVRQTRFYGTPAEGIGLFTGGPAVPGVTRKTLQDLTPLVVRFALDYGIVKEEPRVCYGTKAACPGAHLRFDPTFMQEVAQ